MIKAATRQNNGEPLILLGLTEANIERMRGGEPMLVDLEVFEVGLTGSAVIVTGESHTAIVENLRASGFGLPDGAVEQAEAIDGSLAGRPQAEAIDGSRRFKP